MCLDAVLASRSFERSDQLRKFLAYICEMEMAGRGQEITEYTIGVEALGRPRDFSPNDDSVVRNRAYMLRKKLEEYYGDESPAAALRIELPRGSYIPRFVPANNLGAVPPAPGIESARETPLRPIMRAAPPQPRRWIYITLAATLIGVLVGSAAVWMTIRGRIVPIAPPEMQAAWRGILQPGGKVLISIATPAQGYIREFPPPGPQTPNYHQVDPAIAQWYRRQHPGTPPETLLFQVPTFNSPLWGDAVGAMRIVGMLRGFGVESDFLAERLVTPPVFRNRNAVMFGNPEYSATIKRLIARLPLQLTVDPSTKEHEVCEVNGQGKIIRRFVPVRDPRNSELTEVFGLITSLPAEGDSDQHARYLLFSGISSAGTEAAALYFSSPSHLKDLAKRLHLKSNDPWPNKLQVLIRSTTDRTVAFNFSYETHRIAP